MEDLSQFGIPKFKGALSARDCAQELMRFLRYLVENETAGSRLDALTLGEQMQSRLRKYIHRSFRSGSHFGRRYSDDDGQFESILHRFSKIVENIKGSDADLERSEPAYMLGDPSLLRQIVKHNNAFVYRVKASVPFPIFDQQKSVAHLVRWCVSIVPPEPTPNAKTIKKGRVAYAPFAACNDAPGGYVGSCLTNIGLDGWKGVVEAIAAAKSLKARERQVDKPIEASEDGLDDLIIWIAPMEKPTQAALDAMTFIDQRSLTLPLALAILAAWHPAPLDFNAVAATGDLKIQDQEVCVEPVDHISEKRTAIEEFNHIAKYKIQHFFRPESGKE